MPCCAWGIHALWNFQCSVGLHFVAVGAVFLVLCRRLQESHIFLKKHYCSWNRFNSHLFSPPSERPCPTFRHFLLLSSSGHGLLSDDWGTVGDMYKKQLIILKSAVVRRTSSWLRACPNSVSFICQCHQTEFVQVNSWLTTFSPVACCTLEKLKVSYDWNFAILAVFGALKERHWSHRQHQCHVN